MPGQHAVFPALLVVVVGVAPHGALRRAGQLSDLTRRDAAPAAPGSTPAPPVALFAALAGWWACAAGFADGRPLAADLAFAPALDGRALHYTHADRPPTTYWHEAVWGYNAASRRIMAVGFSGAAGRPETTPALFTAGAWSVTAVALTADTLKAPPWAPNRFTYRVVCKNTQARLMSKSDERQLNP